MSNSTRRKFIHQIAVGSFAGSALFGSGRVFASASGRKMTIDLQWQSIGVKADQFEAIDLAHKYQFESVAPVAQDLGKLSNEQLDGLGESMKSKGLVFGAANLGVDFRNDVGRFEKGMADLTKAAASLQRARVTRMGTWLNPTHSELTYRQNLRQHAERLRRIAKVLDDYGLRLGLEYVGPKTSWSRQRFPFVHTMVETKELIAEIRRDNVGFVLDSWHWYTAGETADDLLTLKNRDVVAVDLNDAPAGIPVDEQMDLSRELPCATGVIDVDQFLNALEKIGYDGPVRAEPFNKRLNQMANNDLKVATTARAMKAAFALIR